MAALQDEALLNFSDSDKVDSETEDHVSGQASSSEDSDTEQINGNAMLSRNKSIKWKAQTFLSLRLRLT
ncbi:hypothetical protein C0J52_03021 [Blattella germanica]|nr:hypothetical protein C0J52_03021 [Blattella germanica]